MGKMLLVYIPILPKIGVSGMVKTSYFADFALSTINNIYGEGAYF